MKTLIQYLEEKGLWDNIHAKRKRIASGSGERMRAPGSKGAPTAQNFKDAQEEVRQLDEYGNTARGQKMLTKVQKRAVDRVVSKKADTDPEYAKKNSDTAKRAWDRMTDTHEEHELDETAAWTRKAGKNPEGGLNRKGIMSYRRENPGSKLSMAVTTKPSKLDPDSKAAKRRKSFCARMSGVDGPMKKPNGEPTRKALALRKWNC
jgi:hypothetical protein